MSLLSMVEAKLPPGFRFHPKDEELVCDYLMKKVMGINERGSSHALPLLMEVDLNNCEPWDLPEAACVGGKEWYFYNLRDRKYATGVRTNRATVSGYWKATGKDRQIIQKGVLVGMKKTLVFYQGRAPKGRKTNWVMHEHRMEGPSQPTKRSSREDWVLCRVFHKGKGRRASTKSIIGEDEDYYDNDPIASSSTLPPLTLTDSSYIIFDQTPPNPKQFVQVPCFSISTSPSQQTNPNLSQLAQNQIISTKDLTNFEGFPHCDADPFACDSKVIKVVLDHLTKIESKTKMDFPPSFGECSSVNYLPLMGFPSMLNY